MDLARQELVLRRQQRLERVLGRPSWPSAGWRRGRRTARASTPPPRRGVAILVSELVDEALDVKPQDACVLREGEEVEALADELVVVMAGDQRVESEFVILLREQDEDQWLQRRGRVARGATLSFRFQS